MRVWQTISGVVAGYVRSIVANDGNAGLAVTQNSTGNIIEIWSGGSIRFSMSHTGTSQFNGQMTQQFGFAYLDSVRASALVEATIGTSTAYAQSVGVADCQYTPVGNTAGVLTTLYSYSLPANALDVAGKALRIKSCGKLAVNANSKTINLLFGGTTLATYTGTASGLAWEVEASVIKTGASTQAWSAKLSISGLASLLFNGTSAEVDTAAIAIVTQGNGAGASDVVGTMQVTEYLS